MAVSRRLRFEILRRDNHTCRYCGRSAPEVPLRVDHVVPVALGGSDDPSNLVTACEPCNSGKSSVPVDSPLVDDVAADAARWAAAIATVAAQADEQLREVCAWFKPIWYGTAEHYGRTRRLSLAPGVELHPADDVDYLGRVLVTHAPRPKDWIEKVSRFLTLGLPKSVIEGHVERTMSRELAADSLWPYFCGCCWNSIRDLQEQAAQLLQREQEGGI